MILNLLIIFSCLSISIVASEDSFNPQERKAVQKIIGYNFNNPRLLDQAFIHSSKGNQRFDDFEFKGDGYINALIRDLMPPLEDVKRRQAFYEGKINNEFFKSKYQNLGLSRYLKHCATNGTDFSSIYANAFEAIFGAIAEDYYEKNPSLRGKARVFKVLAPVIKRLILEDSPPPLLASASVAKAVSVPQTSTSKKQKETIRISKGGSLLEEATAKGKTQEKARENAMLILWTKLNFPKEKKKTMEKFRQNCSRGGYQVG
jgi:predicted RNase H-like HicB family nuclease